MTEKIAVFDAEYNLQKTHQKIKKIEMIQYAMSIHTCKISKRGVLYDFNQNPECVFKSYVKPEHTQIYKHIEELTGIHQTDLDTYGKTLETAIYEILDTIQQYGIKYVLVWGPDAYYLRKICQKRCYLQSIKFTRKICDISEQISQAVGMPRLVSQEKVREKLRISPQPKRHNAEHDVNTLANIIGAVCKKNMSIQIDKTNKRNRKGEYVCG